MAGAYVDSGGTTRGLLRDRKGRYSSIDHPDAAVLGTVLYSINNRGQTAGSYLRTVVPPDPTWERHSAPAAASPYSGVAHDRGAVTRTT
jgi:hypothetical protein